jgi:hypothetical protein
MKLEVVGGNRKRVLCESVYDLKVKSNGRDDRR